MLDVPSHSATPISAQGRYFYVHFCGNLVHRYNTSTQAASMPSLRYLMRMKRPHADSFPRIVTQIRNDLTQAIATVTSLPSPFTPLAILRKTIFLLRHWIIGIMIHSMQLFDICARSSSNSSDTSTARDPKKLYLLLLFHSFLNTRLNAQSVSSCHLSESSLLIQGIKDSRSTVENRASCIQISSTDRTSWTKHDRMSSMDLSWESVYPHRGTMKYR